MPIRVRDKGKDFQPAPDGLQRAVCCDVVELGVVKTKFGEKRMVRLCWQSEHLMEGGKPFLLRRDYGATIGKKSALRADLESWRSKPFADSEADDFDLEVLLGKQCQLLVVHNNGDGVVYANVKTVVPAAKGQPPLKVHDYTRVQDREGYEAPPQVAEEREPGDEQETQVEEEDPIPF